MGDRQPGARQPLPYTFYASPGRFDGVDERDASDAGVGAVTFVEGLAAASSTLVAALLSRGPAPLGLRAVLRQVGVGIEYAAAPGLPVLLLDSRSTLRELHGVEEVDVSLTPVLRGEAAQVCQGQPGRRVRHRGHHGASSFPAGR